MKSTCSRRTGTPALIFLIGVAVFNAWELLFMYRRAINKRLAFLIFHAQALDFFRIVKYIVNITVIVQKLSTPKLSYELLKGFHS